MNIVYIIISLLSLLAVYVFMQHRKKSKYAQNVYNELSNTTDGKQLNYIMQNHPDQTLRENLAVMQIMILKRCYSNNVQPPAAADAMRGALNEILSEYENNS